MAINNNHSPIVNPPSSSSLQYSLFKAIITIFDFIVTILSLNLQQQKGETTRIMRGSFSLESIPSPRRGPTDSVSWETTTSRMTREAVSNNINSPNAFTPSSSNRDNGINIYSDFTLSSSNEGNQGLSNKDTKNLNSTFDVRVTSIFTSAVVKQVINTVEVDKSVTEGEIKVKEERKGEQSVKEEDEDYVQVDDDKSYQSYVSSGVSIMSPSSSSSSWTSSSSYRRGQGGRGSSSHNGGRGGRGSSSHGRSAVTAMKPKEKKVKKKNDLLSLNVNNTVTPNDAYNITAVTPTETYTTNPSDTAATATIVSTALASTNAIDTADTATIVSAALASTNAIAITGQKTAAITRQKTAGAALAAAAAAAKAIQLPTTIDASKIDADINDKDTDATKITQDQATDIYRIQEMLDKYAT